MQDENAARLAESMSPKQREKFEAARAALAGEVEEGGEIDATDPPEPDPEMKQYIA